MIKDQPISASIVIVSWNVREQLRTNLRNLFAVPDRKNFEVIVVDNDSKDGTNRMIRDEFPDVRVVCNDFNAGFAKACNQGIALAKGEVIILLNPDMVVHAGSIDRVYEELMNNPEVGVAGIKLVNKDGHSINNVRHFPDFASQLSLVLKLNHLFPSLMQVYEAADFDYSVTQDVDQVRGSFFAFRKSLTEKIGLLDEGYFIWLEEVDFCKRVHEAGLKVRYLADASAEDLVGRSFAKAGHVWKQRQFTKSLVRYFRKWHPQWQAAILQALRPFAIASVAVVDVKRSYIDDLMRDLPRLRRV